CSTWFASVQVDTCPTPTSAQDNLTESSVLRGSAWGGPVSSGRRTYPRSQMGPPSHPSSAPSPAPVTAPIAMPGNPTSTAGPNAPPPRADTTPRPNNPRQGDEDPAAAQGALPRAIEHPGKDRLRKSPNSAQHSPED